MCRWLGRGIALDDVKKVNLTEVVGYKAPAPPANTQKHRYVAVACAPLNGTSEPLHLKAPKERAHWAYEHQQGNSIGMKQWATEMDLVPVGMYISKPSSIVMEQN